MAMMRAALAKKPAIKSDVMVHGVIENGELRRALVLSKVKLPNDSLEN
jgi:hypothetical protein